MIGRALIQRPTLTKTNNFPDANEVGTYKILLGFIKDNIEVMVNVISDVSSSIKDKLKSSRKLGQLSRKPPGVNNMYHLILPF